MRLVTNNIKTGQGRTFEEFRRDILSKKTKVASQQEEAEGSGQLEVEPLHQEGESTEMPKKGPSAKKEPSAKKASSTCGECNCEPCECESKKEASADEEGKDSGHPKAEEKCHNNPEETKEASEEFVEEAKETKEEDKDEETKEASCEKRFVKMANLDEKNKNFLREYWRKLYGDDYVNALLADK